ncbi:site-specific DNA recombinase [Oceanobacillus limi]|uniref:Site-specific DNA recombinase n=1 Tax=Oceanobacillus limi TaxID=930131 RepID=A0A1I0AIF2_9BACI|nr:recombinase family protein [Oceanobacillus limi]SES94103.1 site-specific DNA recombinase [Oceanobacillus limi]
MRTALYIRVSTREQTEGFSISAQKRQLAAYCESQGWEVVGYYVEEGVSAKNTNRPELKRMMSHIENGLIDCVLVYKLDRLTRSVLDLYNLLQKFEENNCKFKSATEVYDTTSAIGRMFITLVASFAQFERERLAERVSMGMEQMTREGKWKGGEPGYGHRYINNEFVIVEDEASNLRLMYDWYLSGMSDNKIARELRKRNITTRGGAEWSEAHVRYSLTNPKNKGELRYGVKKGEDKQFTIEKVYPAIVSEETFDRSMEIRKSRRTFHGKQATSDYYFSGILTCSRCGKTFKGHTTKVKGERQKSYMCLGKRDHQCDMPTISERIVEHNFLNKLNEYVFEEKRFKVNEKEVMSDDQNELIKSLKKELKKIKDRRKKWQYAWANEMLNDEEFQARMKEEQMNENDINKKLNELNIEEPKVMDDDFIEVINNAASNWSKLEPLNKKQLIQIMIDKIIIERVESKKVLDRVNILEIVFN